MTQKRGATARKPQAPKSLACTKHCPCPKVTAPGLTVDLALTLTFSSQSTSFPIPSPCRAEILNSGRRSALSPPFLLSCHLAACAAYLRMLHTDSWRTGSDISQLASRGVETSFLELEMASV